MKKINVKDFIDDCINLVMNRVDIKKKPFYDLTININTGCDLSVRLYISSIDDSFKFSYKGTSFSDVRDRLEFELTARSENYQPENILIEQHEKSN